MEDSLSDRSHPRQIGERVWQEIGFGLDLSPRELQVARCIWAAQHHGEIAATLGLSASTVHSYVERIYLKLRVHSRAELLWAIADAERGLARGHPAKDALYAAVLRDSSERCAGRVP